MKYKKMVDKMFNEIKKDYENKKMIQNGGIIKKTTVDEFLGGLK